MMEMRELERPDYEGREFEDRLRAEWAEAEREFAAEPPTVVDPWGHLPAAVVIDMDQAERAALARIAE